MQKIKNLSKYWPQLLILLLGIFVSWPLLRQGYFSHQDDLQIMRIFEMKKCFIDMQIPCRWVSDMGWGNGYPLFNFYGVSTYYLGGLLSFIFSYIVSVKILFFIALTFGSFGIYYLVEKLWGKYPALTSAILYLFAPYKALDIYVRGALAESMALAVVPYVFYFYYKFIKDFNSKKYFILSTLSLFLFLVTHNIMTVIFVPILGIWVIYWLYVSEYRNYKLLIINLAFSIGLSSFFLLPAFIEKNLVQTESLTRFELDFRANFLKLRQLFVDRSWGYGTSIPGPNGGMSFQIGIIHWVVAFLSLQVLLISKIKSKTKVLVLGIFAVFILSILMTHNKSAFIWERIQLLSYFQFPWRFLSLTTLTTSILGGIVVYLIKPKWQIWTCSVICVLVILLNFSYFKPEHFYNITDQQKLSGDSWEVQRKGAILDYLPKTALEPFEPAPSAPFVVSGKAQISNFVNKSNKFEFDANVTNNAVIEIPVFYFPNWQVYVNGDRYPFLYDNNISGRISLEVKPGSYKIVGKFENTLIRTLGNTITFLSFVGFVYFVWKKKKN